MYHMDIPKTRQYDTGKIEVIARSSIGEALATTELNVIPRKDDYRGVLKNAPRREYCLIPKYSHIQQHKTYEIVAHSLLIAFLCTQSIKIVPQVP